MFTLAFPTDADSNSVLQLAVETCARTVRLRPQLSIGEHQKTTDRP